MIKINKRKKALIEILKVIGIILGIWFSYCYFIAQYILIITGFVEDFLNLTLSVDFFYIIHTIVLSILVFALFILLVRKTIKTGRNVTDLVEIQISTENKELEE